MTNAFARRLHGHGHLSNDDVALLIRACQNVREVGAGHHLILKGDWPDPVFVILDGWACQYKKLPDDARQIIAFMLAGDFCDIHIAVLETMDHSIVALTKSRVAFLPQAQMEALVESRPAITRAFWWSQLVDQSVLRTWITSMGRRKSEERVAHLMCELYIRMRNIGLATNDQCAMPLIPIVLADALGLTPVHVNRVLRKLRLAKVMEIQSGLLIILDPGRLAHIAGFDDNYLHKRLKAA